ncbi:MAG: HD domain-containing phosphohydrolase, partial [Pseudomonadota bacterium]
KTIKVIIITGRATDKASIEKATQLGANDFLTKPLDYEKLEKEAIPKIGAQLFEEFRIEADENKRLYEELNKGVLRTITVLAKALDARDAYTYGHSERVSQYSVGIAKIMEFSEEEIETVRIGGLLHDIGKLAISDEVLRKPGRLTKDEYNEIKKHPQEGAKILEPIPQLKYINDIVLHHHERYDGFGYPDGIKKENAADMAGSFLGKGVNPMAPWILAVSDAYDAITSPRPYREARSFKIALEEIVKNKGTQFDPQVVDAFCQYYEENKHKFEPVQESSSDLHGYPILFVSDNDLAINQLSNSLQSYFTIKTARDITQATELISAGEKFCLTVLFQPLSNTIAQGLLKDIRASQLPCPTIALLNNEDMANYDEVLNKCQVLRYAFSPSEPQPLKIELTKRLENAIEKLTKNSPPL